MGDRFIVVGGDAAGMSAAGKAKRDAPETEVVVFERGDWVSYGACGLPYYVKGEIADIEDLVVVKPWKFVEERGIDVHRNHEVVAVDREAKTVTVESADGRYRKSYDDLLLATGGAASLPDVPGTELDGVFSIRSLAAGRALRDYLAPHDRPPRPETVAFAPDADEGSYLPDGDLDTVAVVGANKIGLELAEAFHARGLTVHVFDAASRVLPAFGSEVAGMVESHLRESGVRLHLDTAVEAFRGGDAVGAVETADATVEVDAVVADVGVEPDTALAEDAGIELGETGAIATDGYGRTNDPRVYAAGDCAEKRHLLTDEPVHWPYALAANRAGRAVGRTVAGTPTSVGGVVGTLVMKALDLEVARTGIVTPDEARAAGFDPVSATITTISRAHYYPGWSRIVVHATADRETGVLLGANMVGEEGVAHRINSVAAALTVGMTVSEVESLDFGYSPPFGPVWDPVLGVARVLGDELS